jgi:hypothetical protein
MLYTLNVDTDVAHSVNPSDPLRFCCDDLHKFLEKCEFGVPKGMDVRFTVEVIEQAPIPDSETPFTIENGVATRIARN